MKIIWIVFYCLAVTQSQPSCLYVKFGSDVLDSASQHHQTANKGIWTVIIILIMVFLTYNIVQRIRNKEKKKSQFPKLM